MCWPTCICSGAHQSGVPIALVTVALLRSSGRIAAIPKSSSFTIMDAPTRRGVVRNTFSGFRSRCTMPWSCAAASPCPTCSRSVATSSRGSAPRRRIAWSRSSPSRSSIASQGMPVSASRPEPTTSTTWSLGMRAPTRASAMKRSQARTSRPSAGSSSLRARARPVVSWVASQTTPIPPLPSWRSRRNSRPMICPVWATVTRGGPRRRSVASVREYRSGGRQAIEIRLPICFLPVSAQPLSRVCGTQALPGNYSASPASIWWRRRSDSSASASMFASSSRKSASSGASSTARFRSASASSKLPR